MHGKCHCGRVSVETARPPQEVKRCNCSICTKLGWTVAYFHPDEVRIEGETVRYVWGDRMLAMLHCPVCGVTVAWVPIIASIERMGVNLAVLEGVEMESLKVTEWDGRGANEPVAAADYHIDKLVEGIDPENRHDEIDFGKSSSELF